MNRRFRPHERARPAGNERTATRNLVQHDERSLADPILNWLDHRDTNRTIYYQQRPYNPWDYLPAK